VDCLLYEIGWRKKCVEYRLRDHPQIGTDPELVWVDMWTGCTGWYTSVANLDYNRVPELREVQPYLKEKVQSGQWLDHNGQPTEFNPDSLSSWTPVDAIYHYTGSVSPTTSNDIEKVRCGNCLMHPHLPYLQAMLGRLDWAEESFRMIQDISNPDSAYLPGQLWHQVGLFCYMGSMAFMQHHSLVRTMLSQVTEAEGFVGEVNASNVVNYYQTQYPNLEASFAVFSSRVRGWSYKIGLALVGLAGERELVIPSPDELAAAMSSPAEDIDHDSMSIFAAALVHSNYYAAEYLLTIGHHDEALAHVDRFERKSWFNGVPTLATWCKAPILAAKAKAGGAPGADPVYAEVASLLERAVTAAAKWEAPLMVALALQDMVALCPEASAKTNAGSRYEEACFELTMESDSPMKQHLESGEVFSFEAK